MSLLKKVYIFILLFGYFLSLPKLSAATPFSSPQQIPGAVAADFTLGNAITAVYAPVSELVVATWIDGATSYPYYSLWNGSNWSAASLLSNVSQPLKGYPITLTYIPPIGSSPETVLATWVDTALNQIFSSVWNGSSWSTPTSVFGMAMNTVSTTYHNISATYDVLGTIVVLTWIDNTSTFPFYAAWDGTTWSSIGAINVAAVAAGSAVTVIYDTTNEKSLATWIDGGTTQPYYSFFSSAMGGSWDVPASITISDTVATPPTTTYDPANGTILATWLADTSQIPTYSVWTGSSWSADLPILGAAKALLLITPSTPVPSLTNVYNAMNWTILTIWQDDYALTPTYSIWNGSNWSSNPQTITGATVTSQGFPIMGAYNAAKGTILISWFDYNTSYPIYSVWNGTNWNPIPPQTISGASAAVYNVTQAVVYNPSNGTTLLIWVNTGSFIPTYSVYTPPAR